MSKKDSDTPIRTIAVLMDSYHLYQRRYVHAVRQRLEVHGYGVLCVVGRELTLEKGRWEMLYGAGNAIYELAAKVDLAGYIILSGSMANNLNNTQIHDFFEQFLPKPTVSLGANVESAICVTIDNSSGMLALMEHLVADERNKRFAFVGGRKHNKDSNVREAVFRQVLTQHQIPIDESKILLANYRAVDAYSQVYAMLEKSHDIDAIVCANDIMAYSAIKAINDSGLSVPEDIVVTGFDDSTISRTASPPVTTVAQPFVQQANDAVEKLLAHLQGDDQGDSSPERSSHVCQLIVRQSSTRQSTQSDTLPRHGEDDLDVVLQGLRNTIEHGTINAAVPEQVDLNALYADIEHTLRYSSSRFPDRLKLEFEYRVPDDQDLSWWRNLQSCVSHTFVKNLSSLVPSASVSPVIRALMLLSERVLAIQNSQGFESDRANEFQAHAQIMMGFSKDRVVVLNMLNDFLNAVGFKRAFVVLHDEPSDQLVGQVRLRYSLDTGIVDDDHYFDLDQLLPTHLQHELESGRLCITPLYVDQQHYGILIVDAPHDREYINMEYLSHSISTALRNCHQIESLRQHSSDLVAAYASLSRTANYDELTGLANRSLFKQTLHEAFKVADASWTSVSILFFDLDGFKTINDSLGHSEGDRLLEMVAGRLRRLFREPRKVARLGGDEFAVIVTDVEEIESIQRLAARMMAVIREPFWLGTRYFSVSASIGCARYPEHGQDIDTLVKHADIAMYRAKERGKNRLECFVPQMLTETMDELQLDQEMRRGLEKGEFHMVYQPRFSLRSGRLIGFEALMRWLPNDNRLASIEHATRPDRFITLAEKTGFIEVLDAFALETACRQSKIWQTEGFNAIVAINLSAVQLAREDIAEVIVRTIARTHADPHTLELEVTESAAMDNVEQTISCLHDLRAAGLNLSIDDFGTGYSSMNYLKQLPVNNLKIDRSFVQGIDTQAQSDSADVAIVTAIVGLGKSMGFNIIAEGVETENQRQFLMSVGCDEAQGYFLGHPMDVEAATLLLSEHKKLDENVSANPLGS